MDGRIIVILHDGKELSEVQLDKLAMTLGSLTPVSFLQIKDCSFKIPQVEPEPQEETSEIEAVKEAFKEIELEFRRQIRSRNSINLAVAITAKLSKKGGKESKLGVAVEVIVRANKDSVFYNIANCYGITPDMVEAIITASNVQQWHETEQTIR